MAGLLFTILVVGVTLTVALWAGTVFAQSYFYTEATANIFWQAPATGAVLTLFYALWCLLNYGSEGAQPGELPYDTLFRFSAEEKRGTKPVPRLWAIRKNGEKIEYQRKTVVDPVTRKPSYEYVEQRDPTRPYRKTGVVALEIEEDGQRVRYEAQPSDDSDRRQFVSPDGWVIVEYAHPTGEPTAFRTGRFFANIFLNLLHLGVWFGCLWLLLRFSWGHALALSFVCWLVMTLLVVPMLLVRAGAARESAASPSAATVWRAL